MNHIVNNKVRSVIAILVLSLFVIQLIPFSSGATLTEFTQNKRIDQGVSASDIINYEAVACPYNIVQIEMVDNILYALTIDAKFVYMDGNDWVERYDFKANFGAANHSDTSCLYYSDYWSAWLCSIGTGDYIYASYDAGNTWSKVMKIAHDGHLFQNGIGESHTGTIYSGQYGTTSGGWGDAGYAYLNVSYDGGRTWAVETTIQCTHIHSVNVGHDGTVWVGYEWTTGDVVCEVKMKPVGGVWQNSTSVVQYGSQPTSILRLNDRTVFGSDSMISPAIIVYDGEHYDVTMAGHVGANHQTWLIYDMEYADGVLYAFAQAPYNRSPSGNEIWVSTDDGNTWYLAYSFRVTGTAYHPKMLAGAVDDGSPFVYVFYDTGELFRIAHLRDGWDALQYGSKSAIDIESEYNATIYVGNNNYDLSLYREPIINPTVEIYSVNLTNSVANGGMEAYPTGWVLYPTAGDFTASTTQKTEGSQSLKINANSQSIGTVQVEWRWYPNPVTIPEVYVVSYDARKDVSSDSFVMRSYFSYANSAIPALSQVVSGGEASFTDTWTTYTTHYEGDFPSNSGQVKFMFQPMNPINQTCYLDNVQLFKFPAGSIVEFTPSKAYTYNTPTKTSNVTVTVDGQSQVFSGSHNDGELLGTVSLSGIYDGSLDLSAFGDGCVRFVITGERYGYADDCVAINDLDHMYLLGGHNASAYKVFNGSYIRTNAINTVSNDGVVYQRKTITNSDLGVVGLSLATYDPVVVEFEEYTPKAFTAAIWTATWDGYTEQTYSVRGLKVNTSYDVKIDGRTIENGVRSDEHGVITFEYAGEGSTHEFIIEMNRFTLAVDGLLMIIVPVIVISMLLSAILTASRKVR